MLSWSITFSCHRADCRDSGTKRHPRTRPRWGCAIVHAQGGGAKELRDCWRRDPNRMDPVCCLSGSFCDQSHYRPPTASVTGERS
jgi:hypothetical protein